MNPQGNSSGSGPHLSIELLEKLLPSFLRSGENRQRFGEELPLFPTATFPPHENNAAFGSNISLSSSHAGTSRNPSGYIDLTLRLGPPNQYDMRSSAMSSGSIFAPRYGVGVQGMHGGTSRTLHHQTKRGFADHAYGEFHVGNFGQLALLNKRRATDSHISASNNVMNPSPPPLSLPQLFGKTAPIQVGQGGLKDKGKAIESSSPSSHYLQMGVPAQAYLQDRLQHRPRGSSLSPHDLPHGPLPVAAGIPMMPKQYPNLFGQALDNENMQNAKTDELDYAELPAEVPLNDTEKEEEEEIPDQEDQGSDVVIVQDEEMNDDPLDEEGKYIIEPTARGWRPVQRAVEGISYVIQTQFRGVFRSYGRMPLADREEWFRTFKEKCTWDERHEQYIRKKFDTHCSKLLAEILTQVRDTRKKPHWMKVEDWIELLAYWDTPTFKNISARNKANRTSSYKGRTHTGAYEAFTDVPKDLAKKFGRDPYPDESFLATDKYKFTGHWVDNCARKRHEEYQLRLLQQHPKVGEASSSSAPQERRVKIWSEAAKGKSSGEVYGIGDLAANVQPKAISLTQESGAPASSSEASEE